MKKIEIACFNSESALIAQESGANRIEFCANIKEGGTTPDFDSTKKIRQEISIDLYVMIRPRGGNFTYSDTEFQQMKTEIQQFKELGVNGFVFGILKEDKSINIEQNSELVELARPLPCTFHRAFDQVQEVLPSLEQVIQCGFSTILTSGTMSNVVEGISVLKQLVEKANNRITIMPGGGLRSTNVDLIEQQTNAGFYHSSAITDGSETANSNEVKALKS
ncbi:copper homeostasis protein CutC [Flavobacterium sp. SM15]|uniref:copper homeostasis protein CutC n=1 Tax=Flavobacterium sp. SM15 TaxID=2908005 RepID=UPI001EDC5E47|nr:copper homeostasis protein CutC [Flavobacterium sp. SM15]MCG2609935.1 copper homeostasis protein CutC [Flavobacterium sp. SM15]